MTDVHTPAQRRRNMSAVRSKDTLPEMRIRRGLHRLGFRYTLHHGKLPGHPDLVLRKHNAVVFVHGCFWHGHECPLFRWPRTRGEFWRAKIRRNREVDRMALESLRGLGWRVLTVWECALRGNSRHREDDLLDAIAVWLRSESPEGELRGQGDSS